MTTPRRSALALSCLAGLFALLWLTLAPLGCDEVAPCATAENCPPEAACVDGACRLRECFSSGDCPIETWCDETLGECADGCREDGDCRFGEGCQAGQCVDRGCRSTETDCAAGEFCDVSTGECFEAAAPYCRECETSDQCGGGQNICGRVSGEGPFCLIACDSARPCPAGYSCVPLTQNGEIYSYNCLTLCHVVNDAEGARMSVDPHAVTVEGP